MTQFARTFRVQQKSQAMPVQSSNTNWPIKSRSINTSIRKNRPKENVAVCVTRPIEVNHYDGVRMSQLPLNSQTVSHSDYPITEDPFVQTVISRKIGQLIRLPEFQPYESEDLRQEFFVQLTVAMKKHRDEIGHRNPFIVMVIERNACNLLAYRRRAIRAEENMVSLNVLIDDGDGKQREHSQCITQEDGQRRLGIHKRTATDQSNLQQDMADVISKMPEQWQEFLRLRSQHSLLKTARLMGVPSSQLKKLVPKIARIFEESGIRDYLG